MNLMFFIIIFISKGNPIKLRLDANWGLLSPKLGDNSWHLGRVLDEGIIPF
jgi:hypothetical protein